MYYFRFHFAHSFNNIFCLIWNEIFSSHHKWHFDSKHFFFVVSFAPMRYSRTFSFRCVSFFFFLRSAIDHPKRKLNVTRVTTILTPSSKQFRYELFRCFVSSSPVFYSFFFVVLTQNKWGKTKSELSIHTKCIKKWTKEKHQRKATTNIAFHWTNNKNIFIFDRRNDRKKKETKTYSHKTWHELSARSFDRFVCTFERTNNNIFMLSLLSLFHQTHS